MLENIDEKVSLRVYFERRFLALERLLKEADRRYDDRFQAQQAASEAAIENAARAIEKADAANEKRFDSVNEFRQLVNDLTGRMMPRSEAEARIAALADKVDALHTRLDRSDGAGAGLKQGWTVLVGAVAGLATLISIASFLSKPSASSTDAAAVAAAATATANANSDRINALSARLNAFQPPVQTAPK